VAHSAIPVFSVIPAKEGVDFVDGVDGVDRGAAGAMRLRWRMGLYALDARRVFFLSFRRRPESLFLLRPRHREGARSARIIHWIPAPVQARGRLCAGMAECAMPVGSLSHGSGFSEFLHRLEGRNLIGDVEFARGIPAFAGMTRNEAGMTKRGGRNDVNSTSKRNSTQSRGQTKVTCQRFDRPAASGGAVSGTRDRRLPNPAPGAPEKWRRHPGDWPIYVAKLRPTVHRDIVIACNRPNATATV